MQDHRITQPHPTDEARAAQRDGYDLRDLGRMPSAVRTIAYSWAGTYPGTIALYQVASTDGLTRNPAELRGEIGSITDEADRHALLSWLASSEGRRHV